ncbi:MAG: hypothetical protein H7246_00445 [Phycisphaerae bacterium]|nr:hypothetical protein [Saprospiraceae bacterium]
MKKILFALPILAIGFFATYCSKDNLSTSATIPAATGAAERGGPCSVTISVTGGDVDVCGLANNTVSCKSCVGQNLQGVNTITAGNNANYSITPGFPSTPFSIANTSGQAVLVTITTSAGSATWSIPAGECYGYGLATTCYLFADHASL